jgi:peptide/nickel transport system permease protein
MTYLVHRLVQFAVTLLLITVVVFLVTNVLPGDVATMILGTRSNPATLAALRAELGLTRPLPVQYWNWISGVVTGNLGVSLIFKEPIVLLLAEKVVASAMLVVLSLVIALAAAIPLGVWAAVNRDHWQDMLGSGLALAGISLPDFFWGILLILLFARSLEWLPSSGYVSAFSDFPGALEHALLPAITLALSLMAHLTRMTRSAMLEILSMDFIRVCRAKGLGAGTVIFRHALRNAIMPVLTVAGLQLGYLFGSIVVVESLFNYTGMGWLTYQALLNRDLPLIEATILVIAVVVMLTNLAVDVIYTLLDARLRLS